MEENATNAPAPTEPVDAPAEDTPSEAPATEPVQEPQAAEDAQSAEEVDGGQPEAPKQDNDPQDAPSNAQSNTWDSYLPQSAQSQNLPVNDEGYIDPVAYKESIKSEIRDEVRFENQETRAWQQLEERYPELKDDSEMRELILAKRINDVQRGGKGGLIESGEAVMKKFGAARSSGKADAQVSVKKQKAAGTSKATAPRTGSDEKADQDALRSGDPEVIAGVLAGWMKEGKL